LGNFNIDTIARLSYFAIAINQSQLVAALSTNTGFIFTYSVGLFMSPLPVVLPKRLYASDYRFISNQIASIFNQNRPFMDMIVACVKVIAEATGFEAVGIRLNDGLDYPYYYTQGFSSEFVKLENNLCSYDELGQVERDTQGGPILACMCGNVICRRFDPNLPFFTKYGAFWSNNTTTLLSQTTEEDRQSATRNRCNGAGYESVGLFPIPLTDANAGLIQLNDSRPDMFTPELLEVMKHLGLAFGSLLEERMDAYQSSIKEQGEAFYIKKIQRLEKKIDDLTQLLMESKMESLASAVERTEASSSNKRKVHVICTKCKKIRSKDLKWHHFEDFFFKYYAIDWSHGFCPACFQQWLVQSEDL